MRFLFERQQLPDGSMPRNSLVNGKLAPDIVRHPARRGAYPILMASQAGSPAAALYGTTSSRPRTSCQPRPAFGPERWEEQGGFSPSTIAAEIAGLIGGGGMADDNGDARSAALWRGVADDFQRSSRAGRSRPTAR